MGNTLRITSGCYSVWFRPDLLRADIQEYWRGPHGQIANKNPAIHEYLQHHFSLTDHGFWPVSKCVGGLIPPDWRIDGLTEVRLGGLFSGLIARLFRMKANFLDEQNIFDRVLACMTKRGGGGWWTGAYQPDIGFRAVVYMRARHESKGRQFQRFIEATLGPALMAAGVRELRTHVFQPGGRFLHWTPGVRHDEPVNRCYNGALIIGTKDRAEFDKLMASHQLQSTQNEQVKHCVAIHAYAVDNTYALALNGEPQAVHEPAGSGNGVGEEISEAVSRPQPRGHGDA